MDLSFHSFPLLLSFILFCFMVTKQLINYRNDSKKLPPGPKKLPLIGNVHQLLGPLPHHTLTNLAKKYGPLMHLKLGEVSTFVITSSEAAKQALKDHDIIFAQRPYHIASDVLSYGSTGILSSPNNAYWRQIRKICATELLSQRRVQSFRELREKEVFNLIKLISKDEGFAVNLSKKIYSLMFGITASAAFGGKSKDQEELIKTIKACIALASGFTVADMYPSKKIIQILSGMRRKLEKMQKPLDYALQTIIYEHKERNMKVEAGDLVDVLLRIQKEGNLEYPLSDNNIKAILLDIFAGGSDSSATTIEWAMSEMVKKQPIMQKAQAEVRRVFDKTGNVDEARIGELGYLDFIIKETLRFHMPGPLLSPRESSEEVEINGFLIPAKSKIIFNAWAIGRDPKNWIQPERFEPERFLQSNIDFRGNDFEFIPFGAGRRVCPGISFALQEVKLALAQLIFHFDWKLANGMEGEELDMEEDSGLTIKRMNDLILIPTLHKYSQIRNA